MKNIKVFFLSLIGVFLFCSALYGQDPILDTFIYTYDDFNGDSLNTSRWEISDPSGIASVSDGFLHVVGPPNNVWLHLTLPQQQQLYGDFGIMVSFQNFLTGDYNDGNAPGIALQVSWNDSGTRYEAFVVRVVRSNGDFFFSNYAPSSSDGEEASTTSTEGKLFILRRGSTYQMGYNDGTQTVILQTFEGGWTGEVSLELMSSTGNSGDFNVDVDYVKLDGYFCYDDFTSSDIDTSLWSIDDPINVLSQSGGFLYADGPPNAVYSGLGSTGTFGGDFEIILQYSEFQSTATDFSENSPQISLQVNSMYGDFIFIFIGGADNNLAFLASGVLNEEWQHTGYAETTSSSGLLKLSRTGSTITAHYNEGSGWIVLTSFPNAFTSEVTTHVGVYTGDNGTFHVASDGVYYKIVDSDGDGDGIPDELDVCPNEDATGYDVNGDGCIDSTNGLSDILDALVQEGVIEEELEKSLLSKVENANKSAEKDNICAAINQLEAFKNQVNAQRGNKISDGEADSIIEYADSVIAWLLDQLLPGDTC